ncbi:hypothetical protein HHL22_21740 [Hymenobacter sp. RP-2-7]|uniref:Uncharacterized protein n=1 Tax=Hymenobacter polaris TaxID=2682546 RepID=A0A7Y0AI69_9BACT|nr:hypothetical protein [Hymenobacter polaris]NML67834.1 hypothetical protein [Hymenobacter polaris]
MPTTRPEKEQATESIQSDDYQPLGRQEAPTSREALYGGNADDNSGSGGNASPANPDAQKEVLNDKGDEHSGSITGAGVSGGTGSSGGTSIGEVTL